MRSESAELGTIVNPPPAGERIAIAGHCWIVEEVDWKRHLVYCTQVKGRVPAYFGDCPGDINTRVLERMRQALKESCGYPYLMANARARLAQARHVAANAHLIDRPLINLGGDTWALLPWLGSYAFLALERLLKIKCAASWGCADSTRPGPLLPAVSHESRRDDLLPSGCRRGGKGFRPHRARLSGRGTVLR